MWGYVFCVNKMRKKYNNIEWGKINQKEIKYNQLNELEEIK